MNSGLPSLESLQLSYRTGRDDVLRDFYVPCLRHALSYSRAVGYFTSAGLNLAARGIAHLVQRGGRMRLVASPHLSEDDVEALERSHAQRDSILAKCLSRTLGEVHSELVRNRLAALEWLVREGALEVCLAIRVDATGRPQRGLFHEKFGILEDAHHNRVAFTGSSNETEGGLVSNFESIHVFKSWADPEGRVQELERDFENLWNNQTSGLAVHPFTEVARELLRPYSRSSAPNRDPGEASVLGSIAGRSGHLCRPLGLELREHQELGVKAWLAGRGRGIFAMATGAGKTIAAMACVEALLAKIDRPLAVVVVAPYLVLLDQWEKELRAWNVEPIRCSDLRTAWQPGATAMAGLLRSGHIKFGCFVTSNRTFSSEAFQRLMASLPSSTVVIADEVHNLGAPRLCSALPERAAFRLGLSATPDRKGDPIGSAALSAYFGDLASTFSLRDALLATPPVLCPYDYWPSVIELTDDECSDYMSLSVEIGRLLRSTDDESQLPMPVLMLLMRRARLVGSASRKIPAALELMEPFKRTSQTLVYCGDGSVEADGLLERDDDAAGASGDSSEVRQVEAMAAAMATQLGMTVATYTSRTSKEERRFRLKEFERGNIQALVAIRCLDEGVDVPGVRRAFILASSSNPRQFIQRRGRVLRRSQGKDKADIFDLIVAPPDVSNVDCIEPSSVRSLLRLVEKEFERVTEFSDLALNRHQARVELLPLLKRLRLEHL